MGGGWIGSEAEFKFEHRHFPNFGLGFTVYSGPAKPASPASLLVGNFFISLYFLSLFKNSLAR
jgi:hypothetical protein